MKVAVFDTHSYDRHALLEANQRHQHELRFLETRLTPETAKLAAGFPAVCSFVNDRIDRTTAQQLHASGVRLISTRSAGYNHIDGAACAELGIPVVRVPEYSPYAVAEHTIALILSLNRRIHRAYNRVRELNFSLDGLVGFDLHGKTVGIIGTGRIGAAFASIMRGFGCRVLAFDLSPDQDLAAKLGIDYVDFPQLLRRSDIISLHVPLSPATHHLIDEAAFGQMKSGVMLVNTSRGGLIETRSLISALKSGKIGSAALDVYEEEEGVFFHNLSESILKDDVLARLLTFPNVLITSHQAFLTHEALANIANTTLESISAFERGEALSHRVN
jgi:D-lactate dehydrogenase